MCGIEDYDGDVYVYICVNAIENESFASVLRKYLFKVSLPYITNTNGNTKYDDEDDEVDEERNEC